MAEIVARHEDGAGWLAGWLADHPLPCLLRCMQIDAMQSVLHVSLLRLPRGSCARPASPYVSPHEPASGHVASGHTSYTCCRLPIPHQNRHGAISRRGTYVLGWTQVRTHHHVATAVRARLSGGASRSSPKYHAVTVTVTASVQSIRRQSPLSSPHGQ